MGIPYTDESLGNILRLKGLKNVGRRRVGGEGITKPEYMQPPMDLDLTGTRTENMPIADEIQGGLAPESYDVRANEINTPDKTKSMWQRFVDYAENRQGSESQAATPERNVLSDLGRAMKGQGPEPEKFQYAGLWPDTYTGEAPGPLSPREEQPQQEMSYADIIKNTKPYGMQAIRGLEQRQEQENAPSIPSSPQNALGLSQEAIKDLQETQKQQNAMRGASNQVAANPELRQKVYEIIGQDFNEQMQAQTSETEKVMDDLENNRQDEIDRWTQSEKDLAQRIENNQATDMDKYYIGLALLMPLLLGGLFGKEVGLGALAGGTKGLSEALGNRLEQGREDEQLLNKIRESKSSAELEKGKLGLERLKYRQAAEKELPQAHLKGKRMVYLQDPKTGERIIDPNTGEPVGGAELKPGFYAQPRFVQNEKEKEQMEKKITELEKYKQPSETIFSTTDQIADIFDQLDEPGFWSHLAGVSTSLLSPGALSWLTQDVVIDGRKVDARIALEQLFSILHNVYGQEQGLGQMDAAAQKFAKNIATNPSTTFASKNDSINQLIKLRNLATEGYLQRYSSAGFEPRLIVDEYAQRNNDFINKINKPEERKITSKALKPQAGE